MTEFQKIILYSVIFFIFGFLLGKPVHQANFEIVDAKHNGLFLFDKRNGNAWIYNEVWEEVLILPLSHNEKKKKISEYKVPYTPKIIVEEKTIKPKENKKQPAQKTSSKKKSSLLDGYEEYQASKKSSLLDGYVPEEKKSSLLDGYEEYIKETGYER